MTLLEGRINSLNAQMDSSKASYQQAEAKTNSIKSAIDASTNRRNDLEDQYKSKCEEMQHERESSKDVDSNFRTLQDEIRYAHEETEQAKRVKEEREGWLQNLKNQMEWYQKDIQAVLQKIQPYDQIINSPAPTPRYDYYCKNGHHNCPNLPNDQKTLLNQIELDQYNFKIAQAKGAKNLLLKEKEGYEEQYRKLEKEYYSMKDQVNSANENYKQCQRNLDELQRQLEETKNTQKQENQHLERLQEEASDLSSEISKARNEVYNLQGDLGRANSEAERLKMIWKNAELQLKSVWMQYQALRDSMNNNVVIFPSQKPSDQGLSREEQIKQLALQSVQLQQNPNQPAETTYSNAYEEPATSNPPSTTPQNKTQEQYPKQETVPSSQQPSSDSQPENDRERQIWELARQEVEALRRKGKNTVAQVQQVIKDSKQVISDVVTTVTDNYPFPQLQQTKIIVNDMQEIVGNPPPEHTGNLIVDYKNRRKNERKTP